MTKQQFDALVAEAAKEKSKLESGAAFIAEFYYKLGANKAWDLLSCDKSNLPDYLHDLVRKDNDRLRALVEKYRAALEVYGDRRN